MYVINNKYFVFQQFDDIINKILALKIYHVTFYATLYFSMSVCLSDFLSFAFMNIVVLVFFTINKDSFKDKSIISVTCLTLTDRAPIRTLIDRGEGGLSKPPPSISETIIDRDPNFIWEFMYIYRKKYFFYSGRSDRSLAAL